MLGMFELRERRGGLGEEWSHLRGRPQRQECGESDAAEGATHACEVKGQPQARSWP